MTPWSKIWAVFIAAFLVSGCKDVVNPHVTPEGDPSRVVARMVAATNEALLAQSGAQVVLTINNAPEANEPLEQDFLTAAVELFEKRNPHIRIQYSPWQYTPDSFFERLNNRTLTDIIEVDAPQMVPIIEANAAADLTENVKLTPEMKFMNPDVFTVTSKNGRTYGVPVELHTLALFYNRRLLDQSRIVVPAAVKRPEDKPKGKGAEDAPRSFAMEEWPAFPPDFQRESIEVAQYGAGGAPYAYPPQAQPGQRSQRGQREVQSYYNQNPRRQQQPQQQQGWPQQQQQQTRQQQEEAYRQYYQQYYQQYPQQAPQQQGVRQEDARERRVKSRQRQRDTGDLEDTTSTKKKKTTDSESGTSSTVPDDTLTTEAELALSDQRTTASDAVTTVIKTEGLPADLDQFVRLAVRLTDHKKKIYGFGPVLYAAEGGRNYAQWCVEAGLKVQDIQGNEVKLDIDKSGDVAQFLKDLHIKFNVTPPPAKCFSDNLISMFAKGELGMMILPADGDTIAELIKRGMSLNDIGIAALPRGLANREHLTYGKCMVINSQLDQARRAAAFKWLMFIASPEVKRMRAQFLYRERSTTCEPGVPLYAPEMQKQHYASIRQFRTLPLWSDYESVVAGNLRLEPSFQTSRFYEALAEGVRPIVERKDSEPWQAVTLITSDFERKFIRGEKPDNLLDRYVHFLTEKKEN